MLFGAIAILILTCGLLVFSVSCTQNKTSDPSTAVTVKKVGYLSKEDLLKMLVNLENKNAPVSKMGAMCYSMVPAPQCVEYVCPTCGEKTLYSDDNTYIISRDLQTCRREMEQIKKISELEVAFDESSYCRNCSPDVKKPALVLHIKYADGTTHTTKDVSSHHLRVLRDFLKGKLSYETFNDGTSPLKNEIPRLRRLLGLEKKDSE